MKPCTATQCGNAAALDMVICWADRNRLQVDALDAVTMYDDLLDIAANGTGTGEGPRVTGGEERLGIELDERLVEARTNIAGRLAYWSSLVMHWAPRPFLSPVPLDVRECSQFVAAHASWIAAQEWAGAASDDLRNLVDVAGELVQRDPERSVRTVEGTRCRECGGELRAVMRKGASLLPSFLVCEQGHKLLPHEWTELVDDQGDGDDLVDAATAAAALGNTADAVHALRRRGRLTGHDTADGWRYSLRESRSLAKEWAA